jgi:hypothetical protein
MSPPRTHNHAWLEMQRSTSAWARRDPSSASLTRLRGNHSSIRTSRSSRCVLTAYHKHIIFEYLSFLLTRRQKCFGGNSNSTNSTSSQSSAPNATATDSASQTSATGSVVTLTPGSASQTSATDTSATDSASQTSATDSATTDSASQTGATDATATPNSRRHYDAPRAVRHSARFALLTKSDLISP